MSSLCIAPIAVPDATVRVPGSKSYTNRALVCAALAEGTSRLLGWLESEDTAAMLEGLARLGVETEVERASGDLLVRGVGTHFAIPLHPIDCRASGTTLRFLTAIAALVPGRVVRMRPSDRRLKVPHIGWNQVGFRKPDPLLAGVAEGAYVYFDHSYYAVPADPSLIALDTEHGEHMTAAVHKDNIFACQFHPEKSQSVGLQMLRNFVERA